MLDYLSLYTMNKVIADAERVGWFISENRKGITIVAIQSVFCSDPDKPETVLVNVPYVAMRKTFPDRKMVKLYFLGLRVRSDQEYRK